MSELLVSELESALRDLLDMYLDGANSGDWGFWDPEKQPEVIAARKALAAASARPRAAASGGEKHE